MGAQPSIGDDRWMDILLGSTLPYVEVRKSNVLVIFKSGCPVILIDPDATSRFTYIFV